MTFSQRQLFLIALALRTAHGKWEEIIEVCEHDGVITNSETKLSFPSPTKNEFGELSAMISASLKK